MRKEILIIIVAAFALNSCGIYTKYKPVTKVPEDLLWGRGKRQATARTILVILAGGKSSPIRISVN